MKRSGLFLALLVAMLAGGCAQQKQAESASVTQGIGSEASLEEQTPTVETEHIEVDYMYCMFSTVDELVEGIKAAARSEDSDTTAAINKLGELEDFYAPAPSAFPGFSLLQIEVSPYNIIYYYTPDDAEEMWFDYNIGITVTYSRISEKTLETIAAQLDLQPTEDGVLYDAKKANISFAEEASVISIHVPESMNTYEQLLPLCTAKKITVE
jgi:hypothetical protein